MTTPARTRYAPSPTGDPHVGNIRTALFAWALARQTGGQFLLRIEDTDQKRLVPTSLGRITESLRWLGLDWDEGPQIGGPHAPYVQSERLEIYQAVAANLISRGSAYRCFCTAIRLDALRQMQQQNKLQPGYDGHCRAIDPTEAEERAASGEVHVVRLAMPREGTTTLSDIIRGQVFFENRLQDDPVLLKSDGFPTYHLAAIVDDHEMQITHVIRGEEWLSSAPKHLHLFAALGWEPPAYAHLPLILGPDKKKLSKRTGDTALLDYRESGYLPEAMVNFLALLGWSLDDKTTIIPRDTFVEHFSLERVGANPAVFDLEKLGFLNKHYVKEMAPEARRALIATWAEGLNLDDATLTAVEPLLAERIQVLSDVPAMLAFLVGDEAPAYDPALLAARLDNNAETAARVLDAAVEALEAIPSSAWTVEAVEGAIRGLQDTLGEKLRRFIATLYVAIMGSPQGIPLFDSLVILGRDRTMARLRGARALLAL